MNERIEMFFKKLADDKEFGGKIFKEENRAEDVQRIAKEAGIELALEEVNEAKELIMKAYDTQNEGELSEEDLENVAGGLVDEILSLADTVLNIVPELSKSFGRGLEKLFSGW